METDDSALAFYSEHYAPIGMWQIGAGAKSVLEGREPRECRFCEQTAPNVTFRLEAHAIPEALGNKGLLSRYECDSCNKLFGCTIENDLGNWSKPMRTLLRVRGKRGVPTLKSEQNGWRIECDDGEQLHVSHNRIDNVFEVDETNKRIRFNLQRDPFVPIQVLKALVKIGLTLLPDDEIHAFDEALGWIRTPASPNRLAVQMPVLRTTVAGAMSGQLITAFLLRRLERTRKLPYAFLVLAVANETYQVMLPSPAFDPPLYAEPLQMPGFPVPGSSGGRTSLVTLDFSGTERVGNQAVLVEMTYDERIPL